MEVVCVSTEIVIMIVSLCVSAMKICGILGNMGITFSKMGTKCWLSTKVVNIFHNIFDFIFRHSDGVFDGKKCLVFGVLLTFPLVNIAYLWYNN